MSASKLASAWSRHGSTAGKVLIFVVLGLLAWLHQEQARSFGQAASTLDRLREARIDLATGYLHVTLGAAPDSPFDVAAGRALLEQAAEVVHRTARDLGHLRGTLPADFDRGMRRFGEMLAGLHGAAPDSAHAAEMRIAYAALDRQAARLDELEQEQLGRLGKRLSRQYRTAVLLAAMVLLGMGLAVRASERAQATALAASRESDEQVRSGRELLLAVTEGTPDAVYVKDLQGRYIMANSSTARIVGLTREQILGSDDTVLFSPEDAAELMRIDQGIMRRGETQSHEEQLTVCGERRIYSATKGPVRGRDGEVVGLFGIARDITDLRQAEADRAERDRQMAQTQRLESLGVLAGGIAHDFNNILMAILGHCGEARSHLPAQSPAGDELDQVDIAVHRAAGLCRQMMAYAGRGSLVHAPVDLGQLVAEMAQLLRTSISRKADLHLRVAPDLAPVLGDASQLQQVLLNLMVNASEALDGQAGRIDVALDAEVCDEATLRAMRTPGSMRPGPCLRLVCRDTGCGMDAATLARVFEPFYTTKFAGRGLGLAAVLGIVNAHGGALDVRSEVGQGTTFTLRLPCAAESAQAAEPAAAPEEQWRGHGLAMVVDDEAQVLRIGERMMRRLGFEVVSAADGQTAIDLFTGSPERFDIILLDMAMPRLNGLETLAQLRAVRPDVRVVLASGHSLAELGGSLAEVGLAGVLQKPYTLANLRATLAGLPD